MRISAYARATNPKYANFFDWTGLANQLGTKTGNAINAFKGALPTTAAGYGKLGAGIGAGVGAINYLGSDDKSIGNLATQVGGGAAVGGVVGYGGASLKNAYQARKAAQPQAMLPATTNASATNVVQTPVYTQTSTPQLAPAKGTTTTSAGATVQDNYGRFISQPAAASQPSSKPSSSSAPTSQQTINTTATSIPTVNPKRQGQLNNLLKKYNVNSFEQLPQEVQQANQNYFYGQSTSNSSRNVSPFANFKIRRYKGFIY